MKQSITFNPAVDPVAHVVSAVVRTYGLTNFTIAELLDPTINIGGVPLEMAAAGNLSAAGVAAAVQHSTTTVTVAAATSPSASSNSASTSTASADGVELDITGVPWDPRIHSDAAERKTAKGVWKKRKGVDDLTCSTVHNELLAMMAAKVGTAAAAPTALPAGGVLGNPANTPHQVAVEVAPDQFVVAPGAALNTPGAQTETPLAAPVSLGAETPLAAPLSLAPLAPITAAPVVPTDFPGLMNYLSPLLNAGTLDQRHIDHVCGHFKLVDTQGVAQIALAQSRPDLINVLYQSFKAQADAATEA